MGSLQLIYVQVKTMRTNTLTKSHILCPPTLRKANELKSNNNNNSSRSAYIKNHKQASNKKTKQNVKQNAKQNTMKYEWKFLE